MYYVDDSAELTKAQKPNGNFPGSTSDAQHAALDIVNRALDACAKDWRNMQYSPYTGHSAYVVLSYVQTSIIFPDVEIYVGQRKQAED